MQMQSILESITNSRIKDILEAISNNYPDKFNRKLNVQRRRRDERY